MIETMIHPILAFGLPSGPDMIVISILVLVLFGAKKLPTFARSLGRSMGEFRKAKEEFESELHNAADDSYSKTPEKRIETPTATKASSETQPAANSAKAD